MKQLFLSSYNGTVTTLAFTPGASRDDALKVIASTSACTPNPSWITLDTDRRLLYCTANNGDTFTGALHSFSIEDDGSLKERSKVPAPFGAAYHTLYGGGNYLAAAFYYAGRVGVYNVHDTSQIKTLQEIDFPNFVPGLGRDQHLPRLHHVAIDPTGRYILATDLGADRIRLFSIKDDHHLEEIGGLDLPKKSFPRHVAFVTLKDKTQLYILNQDISTLSTYTVHDITNQGLWMHKTGDDIDLLQRIDRQIPQPPPEVRLTSSHLAISPDNKYLVVSMRDDNAFNIPSPLNAENTIQADSILSYHIDQETGKLSLAHEVHAGGSVPRQFSLNGSGDLVAIISQKNGWVSIFARDVETGEIGSLLGFKDGFGEMGPNCIQWDVES